MRTSGILLHPTSLPGDEEIGTLGKDAYDFIDFLVSAGQNYWQFLPLGPTEYLNSPYMSTSAFAGNPLLIDLNTLVAHGLLSSKDLEPSAPVTSSDKVSFNDVIDYKKSKLAIAYKNFSAIGDNKKLFKAFCLKHPWLDDYALFSAISERYPGEVWNRWPEGLRQREPDDLRDAGIELRQSVEFSKFIQFLFSEQWEKLHAYAAERKISLIGDLPIFVAFHSADVWANPEIFYLDEAGNPTVVAGVPPDYFSPTGQLWGNPLYRWDILKAQEYKWWVERFRAIMDRVDLVRIDHFRGFEAYWEVDADAENAIGGRWIKGPGRDLFDHIRKALGSLSVIAEDLGDITKEVTALRDGLDLPGMRVLQFAFGPDITNPHLPYNHTKQSVVYTGTHDNNTTVGWFEELSEQEQLFVRDYLGSSEPIASALMRLAWQSVADLAVAPVQDILSLGSEARMNVPGVAKGNWEWRLQTGQLTDDVALRLRQLTVLYGRLGDMANL